MEGATRCTRSLLNRSLLPVVRSHAMRGRRRRAWRARAGMLTHSEARSYSRHDGGGCGSGGDRDCERPVGRERSGGRGRGVPPACGDGSRGACCPKDAAADGGEDIGSACGSCGGRVSASLRMPLSGGDTDRGRAADCPGICGRRRGRARRGETGDGCGVADGVVDGVKRAESGLGSVCGAALVPLAAACAAAGWSETVCLLRSERRPKLAAQTGHANGRALR